jgi:CheY-like chemotaxis protein
VEVDVHELVLDTVEMLEHTIDKRIGIQQFLKGRHAAVVGDSSQLQNALLNLGLNARDAMPEGGTLTFEAETVRLDTTFCAAQPYEITAGDYVLISVRDTGCGMTEEVKKRLFEPFFTTKPVGKGTGMGLASVYGTVKHHKGAISVDSEVGRGSTFSIYLPLAPAPASAPEIARPAASRPGLVLVVDDEELVREAIGDMLREAGHTTLLAPGGREAVAIYRERWREITVVVVDMIMPELNGSDTILALRKINPAVKVVVASGYAAGGDKDALTDENVIGFVEKPVGARELAAAIARAAHA